eukprot:scaffold213_cov245-Pinguiococcus_pyrenoidosus.AAC.26
MRRSWRARVLARVLPLALASPFLPAVMATAPPNLHLLSPRTVAPLLGALRDASTDTPKFVFYASRLHTLLAEEALAWQSDDEVSITTPTGAVVAITPACRAAELCAVSIVRAGDALLESVRRCEPGISVGKVLIQRDESSADKLPKLFYSKFPPDIADKKVLLLDPMLATGGSAKMAVQCLVERGVEASRITFVNVVCCPEGLQSLLEAFPSLRVVSAAMDDGLNEHKYIMPGLGDYGDRYFGTL